MDIEISVEKTTHPKTFPTGELGFGRYFADHMFVTEFAGTWQNARIVPYQKLQIDPGAAVLHYGQAIFEGMKAFRGVDGRIRLFRPEMNWNRMKHSAERLCMKFVDLETFLASISRLVEVDKSWVPTKPGTALYIRPTLIGSEGFLGVRPSEQFMFYVITSPVGGYYGESIEPVKIWVERTYSRAARGGIGAAKAGGNYASSLLAAQDAKKRGFAQVLWLDAAEKKMVEEVGTMNVFFRIGDRVITPPLGGTILPGITRDSAIKLLESEGVKVEQRGISLDEILEAQRDGSLKEIFGTGTAASISPVGALGLGEELVVINGGKVGEYSTMLYQALNDIQYGRREDPFGWTLEVR